MARKPKFILYAIPRSVIEGMYVEDLLDMLRYDGATVQSNPPDGHYLFRIEGGYKHPAVDRWRSFGVKDVFVVDEDRPREVQYPYMETNLAVARGWVRS